MCFRLDRNLVPDVKFALWEEKYDVNKGGRKLEGNLIRDGDIWMEICLFLTFYHVKDELP